MLKLLSQKFCDRSTKATLKWRETNIIRSNIIYPHQMNNPEMKSNVFIELANKHEIKGKQKQHVLIYTLIYVKYLRSGVSSCRILEVTVYLNT